ncbi:MAG: 4a-hydroxytetrahydrobiopterin dehydratase [Thiohalospira sp.]|uniref:4a-hydroxytetrahydrobiopterin dehydratase n=1 Tax=Thiohalospira sp. TaxID=3080549 RepID=UPI0039800D3C
MTTNWTEVGNPPRMEARFDFDSYDELSQFLERAAALSEERDVHADMSFDRQSVRMKLHAPSREEGFTEGQQGLAAALERLASGETA